LTMTSHFPVIPIYDIWLWSFFFNREGYQLSQSFLLTGPLFHTIESWSFPNWKRKLKMVNFKNISFG
jgi:hypothetical protein